MSIVYTKLFAELKQRKINRTDMLDIMSSRTLAKLSKGENINVDVIDRICIKYNMQPSDFMEFVHERGQNGIE